MKGDNVLGILVFLLGAVLIVLGLLTVQPVIWIVGSILCGFVVLMTVVNVVTRG